MSASAPSHPFVSVIVPTLNSCEMLGDLLDSLGEQTYPREAFEVLVVDNGSEDQTDRVVAEFRKRSPVRVSYFKKNFNGPAASRHFALGEAHGEIAAFVDSDCVVVPEWIERGVTALADGVGLVQGRTLPNPDHRRFLLEKTVHVTSEGPSYETCNIFYRMEALEAVGYFSPEYEGFGYPYFGEDLDLAFKVKRAGYGTTFCDEALAYHHVFRLSPWQWLIEPRNAFTFPYLAKKFPELRRHLCARFFLTRRSALFNLLLLGVILGAWLHWAFLALAVPYVVLRFTEGGRAGKRYNPAVRAARVVLGLPRAAVLFLVLLAGSVRFRCVVL